MEFGRTVACSQLNTSSSILQNEVNFSIGDKVRIVKKKEVFTRNNAPVLNKFIFVVNKVQHTQPTTYKLENTVTGEILKGTFYDNELQAAKTGNGISDINVETVLRMRRRNGICEMFVKWKGLKQKYSSWIPLDPDLPAYQEYVGRNDTWVPV